MTRPEGFLPVFSVGSEAEAATLLTMACETNVDHEFVARELTDNQTLVNLAAFGRRLKQVHDELLVPRGRCDCVGRST